ncbi:hypothetical protein R1flu_026668 [Riccia fluitans]|uniref:Uncharacterized protein n=1 Tax=Riccia fluitans TaxID=41844 RepID=A0ABD1XH44_9MARC
MRCRTMKVKKATTRKPSTLKQMEVSVIVYQTGSDITTGIFDRIIALAEDDQKQPLLPSSVSSWHHSEVKSKLVIAPAQILTVLQSSRLLLVPVQSPLLFGSGMLRTDQKSVGYTKPILGFQKKGATVYNQKYRVQVVSDSLQVTTTTCLCQTPRQFNVRS